MNLLEQHIQTYLFLLQKKLLPQFKIIYFNGDAEIKKHFGNSASNIDHVILIESRVTDSFNTSDSCKSLVFIITIQDKWEKKAPKIPNISAFIYGTNNIIQSSNSYQLLLAIFASKVQMTKNGQDLLEHENSQFQNNQNKFIKPFQACSNSSSEQDLAQIVYNVILQQLVVYGFIDITQIPSLPTLTLKHHQQEALNEFSQNYLNGPFNTGIISTPTGTGKTITALCLIGLFWKHYFSLREKCQRDFSKSILWITRQKDILESQFNNPNQFERLMNSQLLPNFSCFKLLFWFNKKFDINLLNQSLNQNQPVFLIINIDNILFDKRYELILKNQFQLVIVDEVHNCFSEITFNMLTYFNTNWANLFLIGLSATPIRLDKIKFQRACLLFGDNHAKIRFISKLSLHEAIDQKLIAIPKIFWIECSTNFQSIHPVNIDFKTLLSDLKENPNDLMRILEEIDHMLSSSKIKKVIAWTETIQNAEKWYAIFIQYKHLFKHLKSLKIFRSHTKLSKQESQLQLNQFLLELNNCMLICVDRCREGFDDSRVDNVISLDPVKQRSLIISIQKFGRCLRSYPGKDYGQILETFCFTDRQSQIAQIVNMLIDYYLFLDEIDLMSEEQNLQLLSKKYQNLLTQIQFDPGSRTIKSSTSGGNKISIHIISTSLQSVDWQNLSQYFKQTLNNRINNTQNSLRGFHYDYETIKCLIINLIPKANERTKENYLNLCQHHSQLVIDPEKEFATKFISWSDFLSLDPKDFYTLEECQRKTQDLMKQYPNLQNLIFQKLDLCKQFCLLDTKFPPFDVWVEFYQVDNLDEFFNESNNKSNNQVNFDNWFDV